MRSDYVLYSIAIIFFIITGVWLVYFIPQIYAIAPAVLGLLFAGIGFYMRPKIKTVAMNPPTSSASPEEAPPASPKTEVVEKPVAIVAKTETPLMEAPETETPIAPQPTQAAEISAPAATPAPATPTPSAPAADFTKIRGINAKRADQLRAIGINSFEDLAKASSSDLAGKLGVSEKIVKMWIGSAKKL